MPLPIIYCIDTYETPDRIYMVMEMMKGKSSQSRAVMCAVQYDSYFILDI